MYLTPEIIKEELSKNSAYVTLKQQKNGLFVVRYKREVFYKGLWNDFLEECRGLVVDKDFNIVVRPFLKIYNYGVEEQAPVFDLDERVQVFRKINGFMVAATAHEGKLIVSTTGSLDSDFVTLAKKHLDQSPNMVKDILSMPGFTFMFECCDSSDPHIVDEEPGLYLIGVRNIQSGVLHTGPVWFINHYPDPCRSHYNINPVESFYCKMRELLEMVKTVKHEGFVFYNEHGIGAKIKSPYYLTKKALMRKNIDKLMSMDAKEFLDEEFFPLIDWIREVDREHFAVLDEIARREYIENWFAKK